jgi:hypothetical protein
VLFLLQDIELSVQMSTKSQLKLSDILRKEYVKPMVVSLGLMFFQQFSGINAVMFYSVLPPFQRRSLRRLRRRKRLRQ